MELKLKESPKEQTRSIWYQKAVSICLFKSSKLEREKHVEPLARFLVYRRSNPDSFGCYDYVIFYEKGFPEIKYLKEVAGDQIGLRWFEVESHDCPGFHKHLWRYEAASLHSYSWIWFKGADTPEMSPVERKLEQIADLTTEYEVIAWPNPVCFSELSGRFAIRGQSKLDFYGFILNYKPLESEQHIWQIDEFVISRWFRDTRLPTLFVSEQPITNFQHQKFLLERMAWGPPCMSVRTGNWELYEPERKY